MKLLIALVVFPVKILTQYGGIVAGVWLAILGQWWAIGYGIIGYLVASFGIGLILMPGLAFAVPALILFDKGRTILAFPLFLLNQLYTAAVITAWCLLILLLFLDRASSGDLWPLLIWSYAVAISPLADMAQEEEQAAIYARSPETQDLVEVARAHGYAPAYIRGASAASVTTFFAALGYVLMVLACMFGANFYLSAVVFGSVMVIGMLIEALDAYSAGLARNRSPSAGDTMATGK